MKRITSVLLVFAMMLSSACAVFSEEQKPTGKREAEILKGIGIYETSEILPVINRMDFAKIITRIMGVSENTISVPEKRVFIDISPDSPDAEIANYLYERGIMIGHNDATFKPDKNLTCQEAVKILTTVMGYTKIAESNGGYYAGYIQAASETGILKGVKINYSSEIDTGSLAVMILNAIETDMLTVDISAGDITLSSDKGTTIMGKYLNVGKFTGIVEGYENVSLESDSKSYGAGKAKIGGVDVYLKNVNLEELLGMNVEVYYYDNDGEWEVLYAGEKRNTCVVIERDNIEAADLRYIEYYKDETSVRASTMDIERDAIFMYNGKRELMISDADLIPDMGNIKLIDNDGNGDADVVIITNYEEFVVKGVIANEEKITTRYTDAVLDFAEKENLRFFAYGDSADFSAITKTSVLNISESRNKSGEKNLKVYITDETFSGKVTAVKNDNGKKSIVVDGEEYTISKGYLKHVEEGTASMPSMSNFYDFRLNMSGEIADISIAAVGRKYAYVVKSYLDEETENTYIKMYTSDGEFVKVVAKEKIDFNGNRINGKNLHEVLEKDQLIVYELDAEGKVSKIKTAKDKTKEAWSVATVDEFTLNATTLKDDGTYGNMRFYKNFAENKPYYFATGKTVCFQIPNDKSMESEYKIITKLSSTDVGLRGPIYIYDVQEGGDIGAIVSGLSGGSSTFNTPQMVDRIAQTINEDDEPCTEIVFVDGGSIILGENVKYAQPEKTTDGNKLVWQEVVDYSNVRAEDLKRGDVIEYNVVDGLVETIRVLVRVDDIGPSRISGSHIAESGNTLGKVMSVNKESSRIIMEYNDFKGDTLYQTAGIGGSVFKYDSKTGKAEYSTASDIRPGDIVLLNSFWWSIKATFIFR